MKQYLFLVVVLFACSCATPHYKLKSDVIAYKDVERVDTISIKTGTIVEVFTAIPKKHSALFIVDPEFLGYIRANGNAYHFIDSAKRSVYDGPYYVNIEDIRKPRKHHEYVGPFTSGFYRKRAAIYQADGAKISK